MEVQAPSPQAPAPVQSNEAAPDAGLSDGLGTQNLDTARVAVAKREAEIDARRRSIIEAARAKIKAEFRASQGLPEPAPAAAPEATVPQPAPVSQAVQQPVLGNPSALAEAFTAQLNAQYAAAERMKSEAAQMSAAATQKAAEAEAKLNTFLKNPTAFLQDQGLDMDQWQARLLNGGVPTAEERLKAELTAALDAQTKPLRQELNQVRQELHNEQVGKALGELAPILQAQFPFVNDLLGPQQALEEIKKQASKSGKPVTQADITAMLSSWEDGFVSKYKATLQNTTLASKLGLSVQSPPAEVAESPQTLTNRVTSSVSSVSTRATSEQDRKARGRELIRKLLASGGAI